MEHHGNKHCRQVYPGMRTSTGKWGKEHLPDIQASPSRYLSAAKGKTVNAWQRTLQTPIKGPGRPHKLRRTTVLSHKSCQNDSLTYLNVSFQEETFYPTLTGKTVSLSKIEGAPQNKHNENKLWGRPGLAECQTPAALTGGLFLGGSGGLPDLSSWAAQHTAPQDNEISLRYLLGTNHCFESQLFLHWPTAAPGFAIKETP